MDLVHGLSGLDIPVTLDWLLGFRMQRDVLRLDPCIPRHWPRFEIACRHGATLYGVVVENPLGACHGVLSLKLDGKVLAAETGRLVSLVDDGHSHRVEIVLG
jgi:cyclic beta-1,2-glucan synthetase